jgi:lipid II:glycine glycyltransferase (peptidoglycan interpeptide bridge formation enzyme)
MDRINWNSSLAAFPNPHILQSWEWGEAKANYGWNMDPISWGEDLAKPEALGMLLERKVQPFHFLPGLSVYYLPRGPIIDWNHRKLVQSVLNDLESRTKKSGTILLKMDPEVILGEGIPGSLEEKKFSTGEAIKIELQSRGWKYSDSQIQFKNTAWLDLTGSEEDWLNRMKPKSRYNLRLSEKKGVVIRKGNEKDLHALYQMYAETSVRDSFTIRNENYYQTIWSLFAMNNMAVPLIAEYQGSPIAGLMLFFLGSRAWYLFGMSTGQNRDLMPNYLLQWEAMREAKKAGCTTYDLWGAPDEFDSSDPMWGVYRFKEGLGSKVIRTIGAWDYTSHPALYNLYSKTLPRLMALMRQRGNQQTRNALN